MPDLLDAAAELLQTVLRWLVPAVVVSAAMALLVAIVVVVVRRLRRSAGARRRAEAERLEAGAALVRLDDAVDDLDVEVALSGARYGGDAPSSLRRARMLAQHRRDEVFARYAAISRDDAHPSEVRRGAARIRAEADKTLTVVAQARAEHSTWVRENISAVSQVAATQRHLTAVRDSLGDPGALVRELSARFDDTEWRSAADAARGAAAAADEAGRRLTAASAAAADPARSAIADLAAAERALRTAEADARTLEETHRLVTEAAQALPDEFASARAAVRQAFVARDGLAPPDAERAGNEIRAVETELTELERDAARRPTATISAIAHLRTRLDVALGDARTAQQRLRGARTALPGTIAAGRRAIALAEASVLHTRASADARMRLARAQHELAAARQSSDPVAALDGARRAICDAEDAAALAAAGTAEPGDAERAPELSDVDRAPQRPPLP